LNTPRRQGPRPRYSSTLAPERTQPATSKPTAHRPLSSLAYSTRCPASAPSRGCRTATRSSSSTSRSAATPPGASRWRCVASRGGRLVARIARHARHSAPSPCACDDSSSRTLCPGPLRTSGAAASTLRGPSTASVGHAPLTAIRPPTSQAIMHGRVSQDGQGGRVQEQCVPPRDQGVHGAGRWRHHSSETNARLQYVFYVIHHTHMDLSLGFLYVASHEVILPAILYLSQNQLTEPRLAT